MIFASGKGIYDPSSSFSGITDNNLSPEVSHYIILLCKTGLRWFPHWLLACNFNVRYIFILVFPIFLIPGQEITCDPLQ